jgi:hypothetical protein
VTAYTAAADRPPTPDGALIEKRLGARAVPAPIEDQPLQRRFNAEQIVRWARVWHHFAVLASACAISAHRGDQVDTFLVAAWEDREAHWNLQRADRLSALPGDGQHLDCTKGLHLAQCLTHVSCPEHRLRLELNDEPRAPRHSSIPRGACPRGDRSVPG